MAAGCSDFDEFGYRDWLTESGVDCSHLYVSETLHTARCTIRTDDSHAQIVTFYAGAWPMPARSTSPPRLAARSPGHRGVNHFLRLRAGSAPLTIDLSASYAKAVLLGLPDARTGRRPLRLGSFG